MNDCFGDNSKQILYLYSMINLGTSDERIKNLIKRKYEKNCIVVDDLWTLSLEKCKNSNLQFCLICEELIFSKEAKDLVEFYSKKTECFAVSKKVFERIASKDNLAGIVLYTKIDELNLGDFANFDRVLVCDGIEISGNIGTIFRTADATKIDAITFAKFIKAKYIPDKDKYPSIWSWYSLMVLFDDKAMDSFPEEKEKKDKKIVDKKPVDKSHVILEIKGFEKDQDLESLAKKIISTVKKDGLQWNTGYKLEEVAFGIKKLVIAFLVEDKKCSVQEITDELESWEDDIQSVEIVSFNKA